MFDKEAQVSKRAATCVRVAGASQSVWRRSCSPGAMRADATISVRTWKVIAAAAAFALLAGAAPSAGDVLLYNPSASVPVGFYVRADAEIARGAMVTVRAVDVAPDYAARRNFTDPSDRFIKRVAAMSGDEVCAARALLSVNGAVVAERLSHDGAGRALPSWSGCRTLRAGEVLLMGDTPDSFDSRYWGPVSVELIEGVWAPI